MSEPIEFRLPQLAASVTSVRLSVWLKREGDRVQAGEPIVEVETDKTNVELEAPASGVVRTIHVAAGTEGLEAGVLLALIADEADGKPATPGSTTPAPVETDTGSAVSDAPSGRGEDTAAPRAPAPPGPPPAAAAAPTAPAPTGGETRGPVGPDAPFQEYPLTAMRRVTATRLQQAKQTVPHFYLRIECAVDAALGLLARAKELHLDVTPSLTDFVVRAAALALRQVPRANSTWADGVVRVYDTVDIAVAVNTPKGLITPIVRAADRKDLGTIARETRALVTRAREGTLTPEEYTGGTFTISNLGMYGVESLYAIVNPPQSCILGVGAAVKRPVVAGNAVTVGTVMTCTLSADHRAIDGAVGAELLAALRAFIEQPGLMML